MKRWKFSTEFKAKVALIMGATLIRTSPLSASRIVDPTIIVPYYGCEAYEKRHKI
jgi:hypothetical protein